MRTIALVGLKRQDYQAAELQSPDVTLESFSSTTSLHDFDRAIIDLNAIIPGYYPSSTYKGRPQLGDRESAIFNRDYSRRAVEIQEFLESGRTVVVITPSPEV